MDIFNIILYKPMDIFQRTRLQIIPFYISIKYHGEIKRAVGRVAQSV
jgi:hypothetical protein